MDTNIGISNLVLNVSTMEYPDHNSEQISEQQRMEESSAVTTPSETTTTDSDKPSPPKLDQLPLSKVLTLEETKTINITDGDDIDNDDDDSGSEEDDELESDISINNKLESLQIQSGLGNLFEHFLVVGLPANSNPKIGFIHKPELLFSYPLDVSPPPKIPEFCFPNGIIPHVIKRTPSCSNLQEFLYGQPHLHASGHFYTFVLSGETPLYGICITKQELLSSFPNFFPEQPKPLEKLQHYTTAPRCYCLISKSPFFTPHFDLLLYLLAQDRLITITRELSSSEEESTTPSEPENKEVVKIEIQSDESNNTTPGSQTETGLVDESATSTPQQTLESPPETPNTKKDPFKNKETKHLVDKKNLLDILDYYYSQRIKEPGASYEFCFPGEVNPRKYIKPAGKTMVESNFKSIIDWSLVSTFSSLNLENILKILGAVMTEQRVVFVCDNLSVLSAASFTFQAFIFPFIWQGLFVPILPVNLIDYLEAPVPFIAGVQVLRKKNFDGLIVDINTNKIIYNNCTPPILPEHKKLFGNLQHDTNILIQQKNHNPTKNTEVQMAAVHRIYNTIQNYITWLVKKIETQFLRNQVDIQDSLKVDAFKKTFLSSSVSDQNKEFVKLLLDTQHFSHFLHQNPEFQSINNTPQ